MDAIAKTNRSIAPKPQPQLQPDATVEAALTNPALVKAANGLAEAGRLWVPRTDGSLVPTDTVGAISRLAKGLPVAVVTVRAQEVVKKSSSGASSTKKDGMFSWSRSGSTHGSQGAMVKVSWTSSQISMLPGLLAVESGTGIRAGVDALPADGRPVTVFSASDTSSTSRSRGAGGFLFWYGDRERESESHTMTRSGSMEWIV